MKYPIYLRPLDLEDAKTSYKWRNNPEIWVYTKHTHNNEITLEIETEWLSEVLKRNDEERFAICLKKNDQYIGNVQLLNITQKEATFHIFIGESEFWGKGIAQAATCSLMKFAFRKMKLDKVILQVNENNLPAITVYKKMGFVITDEKEEFIEMELIKPHFEALMSANSVLQS